MRAHVIDIETVVDVTTGARDGDWARATQHHWVCSCKESGRLTRNVRRARNGGARHVAAQERGK